MIFCDNCSYQVMEIGFDNLYVCGKCYYVGQIEDSRAKNYNRGSIIRNNEIIETNECSGSIDKDIV